MWLCTPPSDNRPIRFIGRSVTLHRSRAPKKAGFLKKLLFSIASSIRTRSCLTTLPQPMVICPTSELPICPTGKPTPAPDASSAICEYDEKYRSKLGVFASITALLTLLGFKPNPSSMISTEGLRGTDLASGIQFPTLGKL